MSNRFPHYLGRNHASQLPSNCIWFDTETKPKLDSEGREHHYLWFGYAVYQRRMNDTEWEPEQWLRFTNKDMFWEWVESRCRKKTRLYLFAHNGAFDLPVTGAFTELPKRGWTLKSAVADAPPLIVTWKKESMTIKFIDTLNIWRLPLSAIGDSVGLPKLPMPEKDASQDDWDEYGKRDAEVLRVVCLQWFSFIRDNDLGGFSPTLASQAYNAFRHRFMPAKVFIDNNEKALALARNSYVGGRVECFKIGKYQGPFYYIDVNSMYPSVMKEGEFPTKLIGVYGRPTPTELEHWLHDFALMAECDIKTNRPAYPLIAKDKLIFPVGTFRCWLATPEIELAQRNGDLVKVHNVALYEKAPLFSKFIGELYALRLAAKRRGDAVNAWLYKILMNSLYGKFGQRGRIYTEIDMCDPELVDVWQEIDADSGEIFHYRQFGGVVQELQIEGESRNSHPAIAAQVTSYARVKLWNAIAKAGISNVYYCDTDSMVINEKGYQKMQSELDNDRLGEWALERQLSSITLHGAKDYIFDDIQKVKGVRAGATWLSDNHVRQTHFVGMKGLLRMGTLEAPIVYDIEKKLSRRYTKGHVGKSGVVSPFRLPRDSAIVHKVANV